MSSCSARLPVLWSQGRSGVKLSLVGKGVWSGCRKCWNCQRMHLEVVSANCGEFLLGDVAFGCWCSFFTGEVLWGGLCLATLLVGLQTQVHWSAVSLYISSGELTLEHLVPLWQGSIAFKPAFSWLFKCFSVPFFCLKLKLNLEAII